VTEIYHRVHTSDIIKKNRSPLQLSSWHFQNLESQSPFQTKLLNTNL
jgi:hypothetical protein